MNEYEPHNSPSPSPNGASLNGMAAPDEMTQAAIPPLAPARSRRGNFKMTFIGIYIFVMSFLAGIFFTIFMQNNFLQGTPLEAIQRPILDLSHIPADAHKEWLAFQESFTVADRYFYGRDKIDHKEMVYAAAEAAINVLGDRFTAFNRPQIAKANSDFISGKFVGIGVTPEIRDGRYLIKRLIDGSPAQKAGIKEGDALVAINGERLPDKMIDFGPVSEKLRGEIGNRIKVTFQRPADNNKETEYDLVRAELINPSVDARLLPNNIVYIEMTRVFGENTMKEFDEKVGALAKNNPAGYVLDLRGNGGGSTETAKQLLGRFLDGGVAYYEDIPYQDVHLRPANVINNSELKLFDKPLVILVDGGSASASEITAAALHDRKRGILIGEKTFGKGSAQLVVPLKGNAALRVTSEHWFTPDKINLYDTKGIKPDIEVIPTEAQKKANQDPQLDRAVQYIIGQA